MLPSDVAKRKESREQDKMRQADLDAHIREIPKPERKAVYTHEAFRRAAIEWLIATGQVSTHASALSALVTERYAALAGSRACQVQRDDRDGRSCT